MARTKEEKGTGINQVGKLLRYERTAAGISAEQLCAGICSRSYLARIEEGERGCEKIVSEALLQRLGVSQECFLYFLNAREQEWFSARDDLAAAVDSGREADYHSARAAYIRLTKGQSKLHQQFLLLAEAVWDWKAGGNTGGSADGNTHGGSAGIVETAAEKIRRAWSLTQPVRLLEKPAPQGMSHMELSLKSLYVRMQEERGRIREALDGYRDLLEYLGKAACGRERSAFYVQIGYRHLLLLEKSGDGAEESGKLYEAYMLR